MSAVGQPSFLRVGAASDRGRVRGENQDRISRFRSAYGEAFLVVDGMGGHGDGGRAAEIAVATLEAALVEAGGGVGEAEAMSQAVDLANRELLRQSAAAGEDGRKMGATLVLTLIQGIRARVAHAGDCRAYLVRGNVLRPLTHDHTLVQQMVDAHMLSPEEARDHPDSSVVTRALGQEDSLALEIGEPLPLEPGDRLLLCSDGLTGYLGDPEIESSLALGGDVQTATERLIALALTLGGEDNVSVQLIELAEAPAAPSDKPAAEVSVHSDVGPPNSGPQEQGVRTTLPSAALACANGPSCVRKAEREARSVAATIRIWLLVVGVVGAVAASVWVWLYLRSDADMGRPTKPADQAPPVERAVETGSEAATLAPFPATPLQPARSTQAAEEIEPPSLRPENDHEPDLSPLSHREP